MKLSNVALYLRKSREEETESRETTLARHERMLTDYCRNNGLKIVKTFKEVVSGESLDSRPQARAMLAEVADGHFDGVAVIELERLSRGNQIDQVEILETFKNSNTKIYTLNKVYDLAGDNEFDEEFFEFGLFMSRREYKIIKRRLIRGKKQAQKEGYYIGSSLPYGFGKVRGDKGYILTPNDETPIVQLIFQKFVYDDFSLADLRHYLDNNGIKPHRATAWSSAVLKKILKNKCYIGYINYNSRSTRTQECYKGKHDAIIDDETFERAQAKLAQSSHKLKKGTELKNPLASLVKCSECGSTLQRCNEYMRCLTPNCPTVLSYFDDVEKRLIDEITTELKGFKYYIANYGEEIERQRITRDKELAILQKEIDKRNGMLNKACEMLEIGVYSNERYIERVNILESEIKAITEQMTALSAISTDESEKAKKAIPILEKCLSAYWSLSAQDKNDMLKCIIDRVEYSKLQRSNRWHKVDSLELKIFLKL